MVESESMLRSRPWHAQRLFLLLSAAAHFRADLTAEGFTVHHVRGETTVDAIDRFRGTSRPDSVVSAEPGSHAQYSAWRQAGVEFVPTDLFLTSRADFASWNCNAFAMNTNEPCTSPETTAWDAGPEPR